MLSEYGETWDKLFACLDQELRAEEGLLEARKHGQSWSQSVWADSVAKLAYIAREALNEVADARGYPRPGENFRLVCGSVGGDDVSYFAEDRETKILAYSRGRDAASAQRHSMYMLRQAIADPENSDRTHASICGCPVCGRGGLTPDEE